MYFALFYVTVFGLGPIILGLFDIGMVCYWVFCASQLKRFSLAYIGAGLGLVLFATAYLFDTLLTEVDSFEKVLSNFPLVCVICLLPMCHLVFSALRLLRKRNDKQCIIETLVLAPVSTFAFFILGAWIK